MWFLVSAHSHFFECILSQRREEKCVHTKEVIQLLTHHRILENAPEEYRLSWSHAEGLLAGHS